MRVNQGAPPWRWLGTALSIDFLYQKCAARGKRLPNAGQLPVRRPFRAQPLQNGADFHM
jgi:hypothetical protein